ncbi:MAG TPA: hypothetical protein VGM67_18115 [Gemmatimonadaceae bacterium]|jgi:uncharacterized membrane-anchored protein
MNSGNGADDAPIRVPGITIYFWIVKILTTGAGESASDYLSANFNHAVAAAIGGLGFALALILQFRMRRYVAWTYWFAVLMVAVFGTMAADVLHGAGIPYAGSTIAFTIVLIVIFALWYRSQHTLSIHSITTARREAYYWATVIATFALGTAAGDLTASTFGWGYFTSAVVFAVAIAVVGIAFLVTQRARPPQGNQPTTAAVFTFWLAYVLTRPLGASLADWGGKPPAQSGLGYGDGTVTVIVLVAIVICVAFLAITRVDVNRGVA